MTFGRAFINCLNFDAVINFLPYDDLIEWNIVEMVFEELKIEKKEKLRI